MLNPRVAVILTNAARQIQWVNHDFTLITGYRLDEVIGKKPSILQGEGTSIEDIDRLRKNLESNEPFKDSIINYTKDNKEYLCKFVIYPILDDTETLINFIAFEIDANHQDDSILPPLHLKNRYLSSSLRDPDQNAIYIRLCILMPQEKLYLNPDLTLKDLALRLKTNTRYLSQVVNTLSGFNLQHFINTYRIEEVKSKLLSDEYNNFTSYGIAQQCGFKNKSTFYKVFREITGQTPKDYLKQVTINC